MTNNEFLSLMKSRGAVLLPPGNTNDTITANTNLQDMRAAALPQFLQELYKTCSGMTMGAACIFGPTESDRGIKYPLPSIIKINQEVSGYKKLAAKTVFGRNDLFWFAVDAFGVCYMLDNLTLSVLRKYDDPYRAMIDCLIVGKI